MPIRLACIHFNYYLLYSPHIGLDVAVEVGLLGDAGGFEELADDLLDVGGNGTGAVAIAIVACAGELLDEAVLDGTLLPAWHVVVEKGEADGHTADLVAAVHGALGGLNLRMTKVDTVGDEAVLRDVGCEQCVETMLLQGTMFCEAGQVGPGFLTEDFFA